MKQLVVNQAKLKESGSPKIKLLDESRINLQSVLAESMALQDRKGLF